MGAEESKLSHLKHEKLKKEDRSGKDGNTYYQPGLYTNQHAYDRGKTNYTDSYYGSLKPYHHEKYHDYSSYDRNEKYHEKENRDRRRRHHSDDRSSGHRRYDDKSSHRNRVRSDDRDSSTKKKTKPDKRKKESPRSTQETTKDNKTRKDGKKRKSSPESKAQSPDTKEKSEKHDKSSSCLPNVSQVRRRKKKGELEKHKRAHRSAPDLSNDDMSRVGAWLNSNSFWPPDSTGWHPGYSLSYGALPDGFPRPPLDGAGNPQPIVDGMGSPLGTVYADGTFVPNASTTNSLGRQASVDPPSSLRYSMPPYFQLPYLPYYYPPPVPYNYLQNPDTLRGNPPNQRLNMRNRSRSDNHVDAVGNEEKIEPIYASVKRVKKKQKNTPDSAPVEETSRLRDSVSSCPSSVRVQTGEYYSDIVETKNSLHNLFSYKANRQIAVDDVRHVEMEPIKTPNVTDIDSSSHSSFTDSSCSCNDIELGSGHINIYPKTVKNKVSTSQGKSDSNLLAFQPISQREVFIDDIPTESDTTKTKKTTARPKEFNNDSRNHPVVRLGERESIVATSFLIEGQKVFCLTKSKQSPPNVSSAKKSGKSSKKSKIKVEAEKLKIQKQYPQRHSTSSKRNSGTWYGLTGSPPPVKAKNKEFFAENGKIPRDSLASSSASSVSSRSPRTGHTALPDFIEANIAPDGVTPPRSLNLLSPRRKSPEKQAISPLPNSPTPKPRFQKISPVKDVRDLDETVFMKAATNEFTLKPRSNRTKQESSKDAYISDSSDSEPLMRDDDYRITRKLIRIDSRDSFTMKRRLKYHRRSSSLTDKTVPKRDSFNRRDTLPKTSRSDTQLNDIETSGSASNHNQYLTSNSSFDGQTVNPMGPYVDALLHKAKSEEILKKELSRSSEQLLSDFSPPRKKETLQERAARILGLSAGDLYQAKEKQAAQKALLFADLDAEYNATSYAESSITTVTSSISALGNISHPSVASSVVSPRFNDEEPSGSFAVSVTESMINRGPEKIEIKNLDTPDYSDSSVDVSSISSDSTTSLESSDFTPVPDAEFMIEVSDSVLEDATVPCRVKPHKEILHLNPAKEYKLPEDIFVDAETTISAATALFSPTSAQASIAANYADSIYERVPAAHEVSHTSELSDDTTETESLDQSSRFLEMTKQREINRAATTFGKTTLEQKRDQQLDKVIKGDETINNREESRTMASPVPVASFSAPLTQGELNIIMQLYDNADDNASVSSYDSPAIHKQAAPRHKNDLQKEKIAKAIGFNVDNIGQGSNSKETSKEAELENMEDFEIKVFTGNKSRASPSSTPQEQERKKSDSTETKSSGTESEVEVMQSLGLNPEETWLVSL